MGKKSQPSHTTQTTEVKLPKWVEQASQSNYQLAQQIANKPFTQYEGDRVADLSNMTTDAFGLLKQNIGAGDPLYERAANLYDESAGPLDVNKYLNPYLANVEGGMVDAAERGRKLATMTGSDTARSQGAFGGTRHGVAEGVTNSEFNRNLMSEVADLHAKGYDSATATAIAQQGSQRAAAGGLLDTAGKRQASVMTDVGGLLSAGATEQGQAQKEINADMDKFNEANNADVEKLNLLLASLGMSPYGKTETTTKTGQSESAGTDWATTLLGFGKILAGLSDRRDKTDIKKVGKSKTTGLPLYAYRYKGDPKNYPKIVGPMAQDVEKKYPGAVQEVGGHKTVPLGLLAL
jgi:hypothetical protein